IVRMGMGVSKREPAGEVIGHGWR
ncbi:MAG: hypothetical protein RLZZ440_1920, partial [Planctomycetota bacterium]